MEVKSPIVLIDFRYIPRYIKTGILMFVLKT